MQNMTFLRFRIVSRSPVLARVVRRGHRMQHVGQPDRIVVYPQSAQVARYWRPHGRGGGLLHVVTPAPVAGPLGWRVVRAAAWMLLGACVVMILI